MTDEKPISEQLREALAESRANPAITISWANLHDAVRAALPAIERLEAGRERLVRAASAVVAERKKRPLRPMQPPSAHRLDQKIWALEATLDSSAPSTPEPREPETAEVCAECGDEIDGEPPFSMHKPMPESAYDHQPRTERSEPVGEGWQKVGQRSRYSDETVWRCDNPIDPEDGLPTAYPRFAYVPLAVERAIEAPWKARAEAAEAALERATAGDLHHEYAIVSTNGQQVSGLAPEPALLDGLMSGAHSKPSDYIAVRDVRRSEWRALSRTQEGPQGHAFQPVNGHPDDDECTHRADGTDATYCGHPKVAHEVRTQEGGAQNPTEEAR